MLKEQLQLIEVSYYSFLEVEKMQPFIKVCGERGKFFAVCLCIITIFILLQKYKLKAIMTSLKTTFQDIETESEVCVKLQF